MDKVVPFPGETCIEEPPEQILEKAKAWGMEQCIIIGFNENGDLCFGGSTSDLERIVWLLECAKADAMKMTND